MWQTYQTIRKTVALFKSMPCVSGCVPRGPGDLVALEWSLCTRMQREVGRLTDWCLFVEAPLFVGGFCSQDEADMLYIAYVAYPASDLNCMSLWRVACLVAYSDAFQDFRLLFCRHLAGSKLLTGWGFRVGATKAHFAYTHQAQGTQPRVTHQETHEGKIRWFLSHFDSFGPTCCIHLLSSLPMESVHFR